MVHGHPMKDDTRNLLNELRDGEWHIASDVLKAVGAKIPPGRAARRYEDKERQRRDTYGPRQLKELSLAEKIKSGRGTLANVAMHSLKGKYIEMRDNEYGERELRLIPGKEPPPPPPPPQDDGPGKDEPDEDDLTAYPLLQPIPEERFQRMIASLDGIGPPKSDGAAQLVAESLSGGLTEAAVAAFQAMVANEIQRALERVLRRVREVVRGEVSDAMYGHREALEQLLQRAGLGG